MTRAQKLRREILATRQIESDPYWGAYLDFRGLVRRHLDSFGAPSSEAHIDNYIRTNGSELTRKVLRLLRPDLNTRATRRMLQRLPNN